MSETTDNAKAEFLNVIEEWDELDVDFVKSYLAALTEVVFRNREMLNDLSEDLTEFIKQSH